MLLYVLARSLFLAVFVLAIALALSCAFFESTRGHSLGDNACVDCKEELSALRARFGVDRNYLEVTRDNLRNDNKWLLGIPILLAAIALDRAIVSRDRRRVAIGHQLPPLVPNH